MGRHPGWGMETAAGQSRASVPADGLVTPTHPADRHGSGDTDELENLNPGEDVVPASASRRASADLLVRTGPRSRPGWPLPAMRRGQRSALVGHPSHPDSLNSCPVPHPQPQLSIGVTMSTFNEYLVSTGALQPRRPAWSPPTSSRPPRRRFASWSGDHGRPWRTGRDACRLGQPQLPELRVR
jgi:hypothetical protein